MHALVRNSAILLALAASTSAVSAQSTVTTTTTTRTYGYDYGPLSPEQRTTIYREVTQRPAPVVHPGPIEYQVGAPVPPGVELNDFPEDAYIDMPPLRRYRYVYVNHQVVLVDPETSRVIDVIAE
jgi:hypothetical protein